MKIDVKPGTQLQLDANRSLSIKGGVYELPDNLPEPERKRILATKGVSEAKDTPKGKGGDDAR